jgi:hypothetical protein
LRKKWNHSPDVQQHQVRYELGSTAIRVSTAGNDRFSHPLAMAPGEKVQFGRQKHKLPQRTIDRVALILGVVCRD